MSHILPSDITKEEDPPAEPYAGLRRYVPLAVWVIVLLVILMIPLKIISLGYLPSDDALRHAGKAVSGKSWGDILVLGPPFRDQNFVWHAFLREIYLWSHCDIDHLVIFAVILLFVIGVCSPLPWLKRPETWLIALAVFTVVAGEPGRLMIGRPLMLTMTVLLTMLCSWQFRAPGPPRWWTFAGISLLLAVCTLVHGVWYLWALPVVAFFLAGEFRWGIGMGIAWLGGSFLGATVTGHPIDALRYAFEIGIRTMGMYKNVGHAMSMELQPFSGDIIAVLLVGGLLVLRRSMGLDASPWKSSPVFWLMCMCWVLGFNARRFWVDWGWPALLILITAELQALLQVRMAVDSLKRLALTGIVAVMTYLAVTSDYDGRWTQNLTTAYLTQDNPDLQGWLPDKGGIFYTADMTIFFQTFYKNPQADWKYILGYEPALMPDKDFEVYRTVHWNYGDIKSYQPWVDKMRPADRLVIRGSGEGTPSIPELEWKYGVSGIWIGRLPQTNEVQAKSVPAIDGK